MKLLTEFDGHPKLLAVGNAGAGLYARSLAYCGRHETDGVVPKEWAEQAVAREGQDDLPQRLVAAGLWKKSGGGYEIRDFTEVNRSHEQMQSLREKRAVAGKAGGKAKAEAKRKQKPGKSPSYSSSSSNSPPSSTSELWDEWLEHYRAVTGRTTVRGSERARKQFNARLNEGRTIEELKRATVGSHGDSWCREHGWDVPETILQGSKINRYLVLAEKASHPDRLSADLQELEEERLRLREEEGQVA